MPRLQFYDSKIKSEREFAIPVDRTHITPGDEIFKLWAYNRISELGKSELEVNVKNSQIVMLSKEYGIPSNLTSYICIQRNNEAVVGDMQLRKVPVARPRDMPPTAYETFASNQPRYRFPQNKCLDGIERKGMVLSSKQSLALRRESPAVKCTKMAKSQSKTLAMPRVSNFNSFEKQEEQEEDCSSDIISVDSGIYISIIKLQSTEGFWCFEQIIQLLNQKNEIPPEFSEIAEKEKVWGTLVALAYLRKNCADKKDEWKLVERKSIRWLKSLVVPIEESIEKAIIFLS
mmetsp:Transcript_11022/g.11066  ORF Transcript_11022/g.11066 Transcript_11022/m.11066 type:complete len:288 (+) Transcript_11022:1535-2398(+)